MTTCRLLCGDSIEELRKLEEKTVQCAVTSPPYYSLRDYGIDGQIGLEATPEEYVQKLVSVFREVWRVLKDDGVLWLNLGDSYWGGKGASSQAWSTEHQDRNTLEKSQHQITGKGDTRPSDGKHPVIKPKDLIGIPWMVAFALRADGWYLRQDIIWAKPNPMPESVTDRCTKAHEYIFLLSKSKKYFYDYEAILEPANYDGRKETMMKGSAKYKNGFAPTDDNPNTLHTKGHERWSRKLAGTNNGGDGTGFRGHSGNHDAEGNPLGHEKDGVPARNKRSVWTVTTKPYKEAHFATFPPDLIEPCILAGTSECGECPKCGKAWVRMTKSTKTFESGSGRSGNTIDGKQDLSASETNSTPDIRMGPTIHKTTIGWQPQCECGEQPVPQIIIDPFNGSGTTGQVALTHGRSYIGIDLNPEYIELSRKRIGKVQPRLVEA